MCIYFSPKNGEHDIGPRGNKWDTVAWLQEGGILYSTPNLPYPINYTIEFYYSRPKVNPSGNPFLWSGRGRVGTIFEENTYNCVVRDYVFNRNDFDPNINDIQNEGKWIFGINGLGDTVNFKEEYRKR